jgi:quercetin dioxygenase-like cupin family protein
MPILIEKPAIITAEGNKPKLIREYIGKVRTHTSTISIARMESPEGWIEPAQTPEFDEYTIVIKGTLMAEVNGEMYKINEGQTILVSSGETVRYSTPKGAEYMAVCLPAFSPDIVHREND